MINWIKIFDLRLNNSSDTTFEYKGKNKHWFSHKVIPYLIKNYGDKFRKFTFIIISKEHNEITLMTI